MGSRTILPINCSLGFIFKSTALHGMVFYPSYNNQLEEQNSMKANHAYSYLLSSKYNLLSLEGGAGDVQQFPKETRMRNSLDCPLMEAKFSHLYTKEIPR